MEQAPEREPSSPESAVGLRRTPSEVPSFSLQVPPSPTTASLDGETLRSRSNSFVSDAPSGRSRAESDVGTIRTRYEGDELTSEEALRSDKSNEKEFDVVDNPFAFSPGQLNKLLNPKSLAAFKALGGILGLERGLKTDVVAGLSVDECHVGNSISFEEATTPKRHKDDDIEGLGISFAAPAASIEVSGQYTDRKRIFKDNTLPAKEKLSIWKLFWDAFNDRILLLLTAAAVISLALGIYEAVGQRIPGQPQSVDWVEGLAILVAVVIVVLVTGLNDYRREKQFAKLNARKEDRQVKVVRSGKSIQVSIFDVVVGDILHLESGDSIPADGVLVSGYGIRCDESSSTGESDAKKKITGTEVWKNIEDGTATDKMDPFIISGSKVLEGVGTYMVTSVGVNSSYGKIMVSLQTDTESTPMQVKLARMANWIGYIGSAAAITLFLILTFRFIARLSGNSATPAAKGSQFLNILIVAITIIVVAVPEGLPVAVTLALSFATKQMFKENNLVRNLAACETMGNATTICSDKTGTLTQNKMTVVDGIIGSTLNIRDTASADSIAAFHKLPKAVRALLLQSIAINSTAFDGEENGMTTFVGSKTETALLQLAKTHLGMSTVAEERGSVDIVQMIPFDSNRKCMGVVIRQSKNHYRLLVKGAAEIMLAKSTKEVVNGSNDTLDERKLDESARDVLSGKITSYAENSLRTIGLLYCDFQRWPPEGVRLLDDDKNVANFEDMFHDMTVIAIVGIQDPLRPGVPRAVQQCQDAGIKVRMVTGDNLATATAIAVQCGIKTPHGLVMEGPTFRQLSPAEMDAILPNLEVLARSSPSDKQILVARLKALGETVAVTGDGTNDAPALRTADVGFSMGVAGTEVAKEASSIILLDDNFSSIVVAIMWGRSVNDAVAKFLQFQLTVNVSAVVLAFVSALASTTSHSVLSAVQLLWVNLIMDTFAALALATDAPSPAILARPPARKAAPLVTTTMWKMIAGQVLYQLAITFALYFAGARLFGYDPATYPALQTQLDTVVFNTFVWMQIFNQLNSRRLDNGLDIFAGLLRNPYFLAINALMVGGQVLIVFVGGTAFQIAPLSAVQWAVCLLCALPCLLWAVLLRCIPDAYAAVLFAAVGRVGLALLRPVGGAVTFMGKPVGRVCRAGGRFGKRAIARMRGGKEENGVEGLSAVADEEAAVRAVGKEVRMAPLQNLPPITLTTAD